MPNRMTSRPIRSGTYLALIYSQIFLFTILNSSAEDSNSGVP